MRPPNKKYNVSWHCRWNCRCRWACGGAEPSYLRPRWSIDSASLALMVPAASAIQGRRRADETRLVGEEEVTRRGVVRVSDCIT